MIERHIECGKGGTRSRLGEDIFRDEEATGVIDLGYLGQQMRCLKPQRPRGFSQRDPWDAALTSDPSGRRTGEGLEWHHRSRHGGRFSLGFPFANLLEPMNGRLLPSRDWLARSGGVGIPVCRVKVDAGAAAHLQPQLVLETV